MATRPDISTGRVDHHEAFTNDELTNSFLSKQYVSEDLTFRRNRIRTVRTTMSDADLEARNCRIMTNPAENVVDHSAAFMRQSSKFGGGNSLFYDGWLVDHSVNHASIAPSWLSEFDDRIDELREAAAEEGLPFLNDSEAAARTFCEQHGRSIRPSIFLVGNGNVRLVWENDAGEQIGLQFRADRAKVQCILFKRRDDGISTITVLETSAGLMDLLVGNRLLHLLG